ncbi:MAG: branched-chain amino acid ABC transporter permease [Eubacteriales bacterium]|nr:branched-chain amino acid ABC transporter permease [Eubacteriales bacterium]
MEYVLSQLINGICQGMIYALMAIGYSVIAGVTGMVSFCYGDLMTMGAFAAFYMFEFAGSNIVLGVISSFIACWLLGIIIYKLCYEKFLNAPRHITMICTFAFGIGMRNLAQILFGEARKPVLNVVGNRAIILGKSIRITMLQITIIVTVIILAILLSWFLNKTKWGLSLRAISQDKTASYVVGINAKRYSLIGSCLGSSLGGVAGLLLAVYYQTVYVTMGNALSMKSFSATVLGGLTDVPLSALGGLCIGVIENLGITLTDSSFRDLFTFSFLMLILLIRPQGFASKKGARP